MKIAITGAGAMGGRFGYKLFAAGNDVTLIDYWQDHIESIRSKGLQVKENGTDKVARIPICRPEEVTGTFDLIFVFTKTMALAQMLEAVKHTVREDTRIVCLLNGLGNIEVMEKYFPRKNIFVGITIWTAGLLGPGRLLLEGDGSTELKNLDPAERQAAEEIVTLLSEAGLKAVYVEDVLFSIWRKACVNGTMNSLCALLDANIASLGGVSRIRQLIEGILDEFIAVAAVEQVHLDREEVLRHILSTFDPEIAGKHFPSMHQDLIQHHRRTEIDYLNGHVAALGQKYGIPVPYNQLMTDLIHAKEELLGIK